MEFFTLQKIYEIIFLFSITFGAGGAFMNNILFLKALRDGKISKDESRMLNSLSGFYLFGFFLLIISGVGIFSLNSQELFDASYFGFLIFLAIIILIVTYLFRGVHLPYVQTRLGKALFEKTINERAHTSLFLSNIFLAVSWFSVILVIGLSNLKLDFWSLIVWYFILIALTSIIILIFERKIISKNEKHLLTSISILIILILSVIGIIALLDSYYPQNNSEIIQNIE